MAGGVAVAAESGPPAPAPDFAAPVASKPAPSPSPLVAHDEQASCTHLRRRPARPAVGLAVDDRRFRGYDGLPWIPKASLTRPKNGRNSRGARRRSACSDRSLRTRQIASRDAAADLPRLADFALRRLQSTVPDVMRDAATRPKPEMSHRTILISTRFRDEPRCRMGCLQAPDGCRLALDRPHDDARRASWRAPGFPFCRHSLLAGCDRWSDGRRVCNRRPFDRPRPMGGKAEATRNASNLAGDARLPAGGLQRRRGRKQRLANVQSLTPTELADDPSFRAKVNKDISSAPASVRASASS